MVDKVPGLWRNATSAFVLMVVRILFCSCSTIWWTNKRSFIVVVSDRFAIASAPGLTWIYSLSCFMHHASKDEEYLHIIHTSLMHREHLYGTVDAR